MAVCAGAFPGPLRGTTPYPVHFRKTNPYDSVLQHIEAGTDQFRGEKEAEEIEARLRSLLTTRSLPVAADLRGRSPLPSRYRPVAEAGSEAEFAPSPGPFGEGLRK